MSKNEEETTAEEPSFEVRVAEPEEPIKVKMPAAAPKASKKSSAPKATAPKIDKDRVVEIVSKMLEEMKGIRHVSPYIRDLRKALGQ